MKCPICGNELEQCSANDSWDIYIVVCKHGCYEISRDQRNILLTKEKYFYAGKHSSNVTVRWFFMPGGQITYGCTEVRLREFDKPLKTIKEQLTIPQIKQWLEKANSLKNFE